ncbi:MAG: hypothetical protein AB7G15_17105 [Alphaproteobacteria bacterium]
MTIAAEGLRAIAACLRFVRGDMSGIGLLNATNDGVWRSFAAAVATAPLFAYSVTQNPLYATADPVKLWIVQSIGYVFAWTIWPLLTFNISRTLSRGDRWFRYIVAYNWSQVPSNVLVLLINMMGVALLPEGGADALALGAYLAIVVYEWYLAHKLLELTRIGALMLQTMNVFLGFVIVALTQSLIVPQAFT